MDRSLSTSRLRLKVSSRRESRPTRLLLALAALLSLFAASPATAQDTINSGINQGTPTIRLAAANYKPLNTSPESTAYKSTFDATLYADLASAGIFDIVSKSLIPPVMPGAPSEIQLSAYSAAPSSAAFVTFGSIGVVGNKLVVNGFLFDAHNPQYPQVLAKQYSEEPTDDSARQLAHRFADEIIYRLGGGTPGIAETKIFYVKVTPGKDNTGTKEIWQMDYDGANQHAITHLGTVSMSPHVSPDNTRIAFESLGRNGFQIKMYSLILGRLVNFPEIGGTNITPTWSPDGREIAYSSSRSGDPEIWISDVNGNLARRITNLRGPDAEPVYNPRTGSQIAWTSGRSGLPQIYIMNADGSAPQRISGDQKGSPEGYATSPAWSPDGKFIAFSWDRKYGPGAPGGQDIYVIDVATGIWTQETHDTGRCEFPSWSPDSRHIIYSSSPDGKDIHKRLWTMLSDGTQQHPLTGTGADMPNWSWK
jgi:TolB protein